MYLIKEAKANAKEKNRSFYRDNLWWWRNEKQFVFSTILIKQKWGYKNLILSCRDSSSGLFHYAIPCMGEHTSIALYQYFFLLNFICLRKTFTCILLRIFLYPCEKRFWKFHTNLCYNAPIKNENVGWNTETVKTRYISSCGRQRFLSRIFLQTPRCFFHQKFFIMREKN